MRTIIALLSSSAVAVACQTAQQTDVPGTTAGSTTVTRGASTVTRSDTTRVSGGVTLTLDRATYKAGATVTLRIANQSRDQLGFNQCSSRSIERQEGSRWVPHPEPDRMCTMELRLLQPNQTQTVTTDLPATLSPGTYRMVFTFGIQSSASAGAIRAVSSSFSVS